MTTIRAVKESPVAQGRHEVISYQLTTTPWGSSPTAIDVIVYDIGADPWDDITATVMPVNSPSVLGNVITLSPLRDLEDAKIYRVEIHFTSGGNTFEAHCLVIGGE